MRGVGVHDAEDVVGCADDFGVDDEAADCMRSMARRYDGGAMVPTGGVVGDWQHA